MNFSDLTRYCDGNMIQFDSDNPILNWVYDSRKITGQAGEVFVALKGQHKDGHDFIASAYAQGCRQFIISETLDTDLASANVFETVNPLQVFQKIAAIHRQQFQIPVVGITGSNAKTIVKEWLATVLLSQYHVAKSPKSYNSQLGVPISVWELNESHEFGIFEAGISIAGEMAQLEQIISPTLGIFTNLGAAHAEGFESAHQKLEEKTLLFENCQQIICCHAHLEVSQYLKNRFGQRVILWGINEPESDLNFIKNGNEYVVEFDESQHTFHIIWTHPQHIENLLHVISACLVLKIDPKIISKGIGELKAIPMRLELKRGNHNTFILDDSYNNDLMGLSIALDYLKQQPQKQSKTVILSDILQSGKDEKSLYEEVNQLLLRHEVDRLITVGHAIANMDFELETIQFTDVHALLSNMPDFADETILVKGARSFGLEKVVTYLEAQNHGTILEVNQEAILKNLNIYRSELAPNVKMMVMVKAFAYGVGVEEMSSFLQYHGVDYLGVAYLDEAIALRKKGIRLPIMIMNVDWSSLSLVSHFDLEPEIYSLEMLRQYIEVAGDNPPPIHIKIETGMNRLGFETDELASLIKTLKAEPKLKVASIFTHFSCADMPEEDDYTRAQAASFNDAYQLLSEALGYQPIKHAANSAGIFRWPAYHFDMVRLGIGLYGYDSASADKGISNIGKLKTKISHIKNVNDGGSIGYSRKGKAIGNKKIATVAIGYGDGYSRAFGNGKAYMLVNGQAAPTIGNVCMDMTMLDVTGIDVNTGDEVIVFGDNPNISQLAKWANTIPYEILTNVSQRVKRVFVSE